MYKNRIILMLLLSYAISHFALSQQIQTFQNPILKGFYPDPSICRVGEDYYLATSSFQYWPGIPIFHSKDLVNWTQIGHAITRQSQADLSGKSSSGGLWAPTLRYHEGTFYLIVSNVQRSPWNPLNFYVTTDDPAGEWSEPVIVEEGNGVDPDLFFDEDGRCYYSRNYSRGIVAAEIDIETGKLLSDFHKLWGGIGAPHPEASHIYKKDDWYYLVIAEGGTGPYHRTSIARSPKPLDMYRSYIDNPILYHTERFRHPIQGTGHGDLIEAHDGSWWFVFLAKRSNRFEAFNSVLGRETFLAPVSWLEDDWPVVGYGGKVEMQMLAPTFYEEESTESRFYDDFSNPKLGFEWNYLRHPETENYSLSDKKGWLSMTGSELSLDDPQSPTFLGIRQKDFECQVTTALRFDPEEESEEAGLTVYMEEKNHYEIAVVKKGQKRVVVVKARIGALTGEIGQAEIASEVVHLRIASDGTYYKFFYAENDRTFTSLGRVETKYLEPELFTGAYFGLYASGNGRKSTKSAQFDWIEYLPTQEY